MMIVGIVVVILCIIGAFLYMGEAAPGAASGSGASGLDKLKGGASGFVKAAKGLAAPKTKAPQQTFAPRKQAYRYRQSEGLFEKIKNALPEVKISRRKPAPQQTLFNYTRPPAEQPDVSEPSYVPQKLVTDKKKKGVLW